MNLTFGQCVSLIIIAFAAKAFFGILTIALGVFLQELGKSLRKKDRDIGDEIREELDREMKKAMAGIDITKCRKIGFVSNELRDS